MKIAIIGTGKIIPTAIDAMQQVPEIKITSIFGRHREKAEALAQQFHINNVYDNYEELLSKEDVDFVYVALVNSAHYEYCRKALLRHKNVIVEKPFCSCLEEAKDLAEIALRNHLYLIEAVTLLHMPNTYAIDADLPKLGNIKLINCNYSQYSSRYDKYLNKTIEPVFDPKLSGGALMDINIYNLNFVLHILGKPDSVRYDANIGYNQIDTSGILTLKYKNSYAICVGAKDSASPGYCTVQGDKGWLKVSGGPNEFVSYTLFANGKMEEKQMNLFENRMTHEFIEFAEMFNKKDYDTMKRFLTQSLTEMDIVDKAREQAGIPIINLSGKY